jgi:hypothetical protein
VLAWVWRNRNLKAKLKRWLWIARRKTLKIFVSISSKISASGNLSSEFPVRKQEFWQPGQLGGPIMEEGEQDPIVTPNDFLNDKKKRVYGAPELIPRNEFRQPM